MMKWLACCILVFSSLSCKKEHSGNRVEIYLLKSFSLVSNATIPETVTITNAKLEKNPLVEDSDIEYYKQSEWLFKLKKNIRPVIQDFSSDKGFAVVVNNQVVYYGIFHPAFLSSITFGLATIDPFIFTTDNSVSMQYASLDNNPQLTQLDKRNDPRLLAAMAVSGRLR
jgi:hypothetical protein